MKVDNSNYYSSLNKIHKSLVTLLGPEWVLHTPEELLVYECDGLTLHTHPPDFVVFPNSTSDVIKIVTLAQKYKIPFLARGAGTSLSGGTIAAAGGIILEFSRMNKIIAVDQDNRLANVQPGVVNLHVTQATENINLHYAPDPSSQVASTSGGNVAENAGGPHTLKYGVTTNHVVALQVVLPNGEDYQIGTTAGDQVGYDLVGTFVGSEGTLGIATEVTVRLIYSPQAVKTLLVIYDSVVDATKTVSGLSLIHI